MNGDVGLITELIEQGVDVEEKDAEGNTALHYTGWRGQKDACLVLLKAGASLETHDQNGHNAIWWANTYGHNDVAELMANFRPDVSFTDADGDLSTLRIAGGKLHWYSGPNACTRESADVRALELVSTGSSQTIRVPGNDRLVAKLVNPAAGPDRTAMLRALTDLPGQGGITLIGFEDYTRADTVRHAPRLAGSYRDGCHAMTCHVAFRSLEP